LGIVWLCGIGSLLAIIFGAVALGVTAGGRRRGRGFAIAGLVLGILGLLATVVASIVLVRLAQDDVFTGTSDEKNDVTITSCTRDADGHGVASLRITNDSSKPSSYIITVDFRTRGGSDSSADLQGVDRLDPNESTTVVVRSADAVGAGVTCRLEYVNRFGLTFDGGS
jgi:hypothetical protein